MSHRFVLFLALALLPSLSFAGPLTREEYQRQTQVLQQLTQSVAVQTSDADKFAVIAGVMTAERNADVRRKVVAIAAEIPGPAREAFFISVLTTDADAGLRSKAATALGETGSEACLAVLAKAAASDRTTTIQIGDIGGQSSARRAATFAIAQLAERFPKLADNAAAELRTLPDKHDPKDNESLADARLQALYQVTRDDSLLKPFFERLKSEDAKVRMDGVNAFRFLKLKQAPAEVALALQDASPEVCSTTAMVLGEIGDPKTAERLMAAAADAKRERSVRANAIHALGRMRVAAAADLMEKLLTDPAARAQAAIALYRITGKKVKEFPEGYNAD